MRKFMYKYSLDKSSKKFVCPQCGKKVFVRYIDNTSNNYLQSNIGRCDRESKCQYHNKPNGNKSIVSSSDVVKEEPACLNFDAVIQSMQNIKNDNFIKYLLQYFSWSQVRNAILKYNIGNCNHWHGATIFWQVDEQMNVCAGKVMLYDKITGKRVKKPYPHINWIHSVYKIDDFVLQQCLFGIHNLCDYDPGSTVCIVESEKTAIFMSIVQPAYLWLATGSKSNLKAQLLKPLIDYAIILFPDKTEFKDWNTRATQLLKNGFKISCSALLENKNIEEGSDLADLLCVDLVN
ncbi:DUF6371 domain-containing protein [Algibacter mikhailovii]|uniref:Toprim domain-containing protein n=1 Tax=Algibacter mikhailovii TaxID=425498 RepID=A0A918QY74_9FLAO|nr:DUF6371 domain-containing protein [Algibacter mikhailovii]GGZ72566.1 hypothetical protein GCM10007028_06990 [Algibacter mikhailovii]